MLQDAMKARGGGDISDGLLSFEGVGIRPGGMMFVGEARGNSWSGKSAYLGFRLALGGLCWWPKQLR